jgi:aspartate racemase
MIGIIGGNGVVATNTLLQIIEDLFTKNGAFRDGHHPEMLIWQATKAPSRSMYLEGRGESFIDDYVKIGRKLKKNGCTKLCMCCNTAHYAINDLQKKIGIPFFNLLEIVAKKANELHLKKVGIMCTDGLKKTELYQKYFEKYAPNTQVIFPNNKYQALVTKGICNAKNKKRYLSKTNREHPFSLFEKVYRYFEKEGVDGIVGGCTDISNVYKKESTNKIAYLDSLCLLAEAIYKEERQNNLPPLTPTTTRKH